MAQQEKVVLADLSVEEAEAFQRAFSRMAGLENCLRIVTEAIAEERAKEDELWTRARWRYNIAEGMIHVNCTDRKIYAGSSQGGQHA